MSIQLPLSLIALSLLAMAAAVFGQSVPTTQTAPAGQGVPASQGRPMMTSDYVFLRFDAGEGWTCQVDGPGEAGALRGRTWTFDFSHGAQAIGLVPADISMLGEPQEIRLVLRGDSCCHPMRLQMLTHFMTFERTLDPLEGDGLHEIIIPAPPADGWRWSGGENDGKIHGPLRIRGLFLDAAGKSGSGRLEMIAIHVKARCPADRSSLLTARLQEGPGAPQFIGTIRSQTPQPLDARIDCVIRDWDGRTVASQSQNIRITSSHPSEVAIPVPPGNHVFLEAEFALQAEGQDIPSATVSRVAPVSAVASDRPDPASPLGMGLYLHRYENPELMDRAAKMARDIGVKWSREEFAWSEIEPRKGEFDCSHYDRVVATARQHGISVYGLLDYWSPWTRPYTPEGIEDYCRYVRAVVQRYKGDIHHWEIWNEPNIFFWQGPKDMYVDLLKAAYKTIKEVDPEAQVAGCSTSGIDRPFIRRVLNLDGPFDILTIHPYRQKLIDRPFISELRMAARIVQKTDDQPRPVWITEMGWATHVQHNAVKEGPSVSPRQQACLLARAYVDALASGVAPNISWYNFRNDGANPLEWEHNFGIVAQNFQPKPAYRAFATLAKALQDQQFAGEVALGEDVVAFRFAKPDGQDPVIVAWSIDRPQAVAIPAAREMLLTNLMGVSRHLPADGGTVQLELLPGLPVFATPVAPVATMPAAGQP